MAKQLKAIKCPQCGSTNKEEVREDYYRCNNCNTEYFLDNDDITIHHRFEEDTPAYRPPAGSAGVKKAVIILVVVMAGIWGASFVLQRLFSTNSSTPFSRQVAGDDFHWFFKDKGAFISPAGKPVGVVVGERTYMSSSSDSKKGVYLGFYDLETGKEIKAEKIPDIAPDVSAGKYAVSTFPNGEVYFIISKSRIFKVNGANLSATDVTQSLFDHHPELTSGIANVEFLYKSDGYGFNLIANDGLNYYYYPLQDRLYTKEEKVAAEREMETVKAGEPLEGGFAFTRKSSDFPQEKIQLIKYTKRSAQGGPDDAPGFEWSKDYANGGQKRLMRWGRNNVRSTKDFTPGRPYFDAKVLYSDAEVVLISFANTPAEESAQSLQCLNAGTGEILFTLPLSSKYYLAGALRYKGGFVIDNNTSLLLVSPAGKLLNEFKTT